MSSAPNSGPEGEAHAGASPLGPQAISHCLCFPIVCYEQFAETPLAATRRRCQFLLCEIESFASPNEYKALAFWLSFGLVGCVLRPAMLLAYSRPDELLLEGTITFGGCQG